MEDELDPPYFFSGIHTHAMDDKGRVVLPSQFRKQIEKGEVTMSLGADHSVAIYPDQQWQQKRRDLRALRTTSTAERAYFRTMIAAANSQTFDRQGRLTIPPELRAYAGIELDSEVAVIGQDLHIEIWNKDRWSLYWDASSAAVANQDTPFERGNL